MELGINKLQIKSSTFNNKKAPENMRVEWQIHLNSLNMLVNKASQHITQPRVKVNNITQITLKGTFTNQTLWKTKLTMIKEASGLTKSLFQKSLIHKLNRIISLKEFQITGAIREAKTY